MKSLKKILEINFKKNILKISFDNSLKWANTLEICSKREATDYKSSVKLSKEQTFVAELIFFI